MLLKQDPYNKHLKTPDEYAGIWHKMQSDFKYGIRTYSGKEFNFNYLNEDMICIEDIAHSLSNQCRFGGHTNHFYSVGQHALWMTNQADEDKLECLMHDATETYLLDIPKPIKNLLPQYSEYENKLHEIISKKFKLNYPYSRSVHELDLLSMLVEWDGIVLHNYIKCLTPPAVEKRFLDMYEQLKR